MKECKRMKQYNIKTVIFICEVREIYYDHQINIFGKSSNLIGQLRT